MQEYTLQLPDNNSNAKALLEYIKTLDFAKLSQASNWHAEIPEEHKQEVRNRIAESQKNPERLMDWNDVKNDFKLD
jgi:hypothetical protein